MRATISTVSCLHWEESRNLSTALNHSLSSKICFKTIRFQTTFAKEILVSTVGNLFWTYCAPKACHLHLLSMLQPPKDQMRFHHLQKIVYQFQILFHIKIKHQMQDLDFQMELQVVLNSIEWTQLILMRWKQLYRQNFEKRKHISNLKIKVKN